MSRINVSARATGICCPKKNDALKTRMRRTSSRVALHLEGQAAQLQYIQGPSRLQGTMNMSSCMKAKSCTQVLGLESPHWS